MRAAFGLVIAVVVTLGGPPARADDGPPRRVVLVSMPAAVETATASALKPWSIDVEASHEAAPASNAEAATIAHAHGATTVAWMEHGELVIYDDRRGVSERHATAAAMDDAAAAAVALSIKTAVRRPDDVEIVEVVDDPPPVIEPAPARYRPHLTALIGGGFAPGSTVPPMLRAGARFAVELPQVPHLAIALGVVAASASIDTAEVTARYSDLTFGAGVEWRQRVGAAIWLVPAIAAGIHLAHLEGTAASSGMGEQRVSETKVPIGVELELGAETGTRVRIGAAVTASFLVISGPYKVKNDLVLTLPAATLGLALRLSFQ